MVLPGVKWHALAAWVAQKLNPSEHWLTKHEFSLEMLCAIQLASPEYQRVDS